ncbi:MAG: glucose-6-phosphate isomerase [Prevotellaceae bacterium]|jgi:glucose-6-phosphate isomerase|nr:glucose-6-phosphate isomerase [Prevotellaceae bacterium]
MNRIPLPTLFFSANRLVGHGVETLVRTVGSLKGIFCDAAAFEKLPQDAIAYEVSSYLPVPEGSIGSLYFGITRIHPHLAGNEYMMTKGHFHTKSNCAEYYWGIEGEGVLLTMDTAGKCRAELCFPGSLHYIDGRLAHRMINISEQIFSFGACWPADAGHDYQTIAETGFSARILKLNGKPCLVSLNNNKCTQLESI